MSKPSAFFHNIKICERQPKTGYHPMKTDAHVHKKIEKTKQQKKAQQITRQTKEKRSNIQIMH